MPGPIQLGCYLTAYEQVGIGFRRLDFNLNWVVFLSDEIVQALKAAGFSKQLKLVKCRVL
ncbi:MAG: hypothetical protein ABJ327_13535 [Litoreibacter sp.]